MGIRSAGHAQAPLVHTAFVGVITLKDFARCRMDDHIHAQSLGHSIDGDIIMRGANPASGEEIIIISAQNVHRFDNLGLNIGHNAHF